MQINSILGLALFAVSQVASHPTRQANNITAPSFPEDDIFKRETAVPVSCGPTGNQVVYTAEKIKSAVNGGKAQLAKGAKVGNYPYPYGKNDIAVIKIMPAACKSASLYEWPITEGTFTGGDPLADRVLISEVKNPSTNVYSRTYCMTVTHRGATGNGYIPCVASTA